MAQVAQKRVRRDTVETHVCTLKSRFPANMVAEHGLPPLQERIPEWTCEQVVDVRMPQVVGQVLEVPKISSQDRDLHGTVEQIPDVLVPEMVEQLVELPKTVSDDRTQQRTAECIVNIPVSQSVVELVEVSRVLQKRIQQRFVEQKDETPDISFAEKIIEKAVTQTQGNDATGREHACSARRPTVADR